MYRKRRADAIRRDRPYVFTDDHHIPAVETRLSAIMAARVLLDYVTTMARLFQRAPV